MKILAVDDDPDTRALVVRSLRQEFGSDIELHEAIDASQLTEALEGAAPDVLISDFDLRWSDGFEVLAKVKAAAPDCCCVMFTGTGNEELAVRALKSGFDDYVVKSALQLRRLATTVRAAYERAERTRALARDRDILLRELYHRVHNNLQIVISLVMRTSRTLEHPADREKLEALCARVVAISMLQEEFYRSERLDAVPFGNYLTRLAEQQVGLADDVALEMRLEDVQLPVQSALPVALVANEMLTNAMKHAFASGGPGKLIVTLERRGPEVALAVTDRRTPAAASASASARAPATVRNPGFGMELMEGLARQVRGRVEHEIHEDGRTTRLTLPL